MVDDGEIQVVLFELAGQVYGVDIAQVHEIINRPTLTRLPNAPAYLAGVTNLRGRVIPIIDLRSRFRIDEDPDAPTHVIVLDLRGSQAGILVDGVSDVLRSSVSAIQPPPATTSEERTIYISGLLEAEERLVVLLDLDLAFSEEELSRLQTEELALARAEAADDSE
jgi:purine-binding chemotaxis protein CheW